MRATQAIEFITNGASRELLTHFDPDLNYLDTEQAKKNFRAKEDENTLFDIPKGDIA